MAGQLTWVTNGRSGDATDVESTGATDKVSAGAEGVSAGETDGEADWAMDDESA